MSGLASPRLRSLAERAVPAAEEACELCAAAIGARHGHVFDREAGNLLCACRPCWLLFDRDAAAAGRLRAVPDLCLRLEPFAVDDAAWQSLRIPVDMAYFVRTAERVTAYYPSPAGAVESTLPLDAWSEIEGADARLVSLTPDVAALLVSRLYGGTRGWIVGIDRCAELVALVRTNWRGLAGGTVVWRAVKTFFEELP